MEQITPPGYKDYNFLSQLPKNTNQISRSYFLGLGPSFLWHSQQQRQDEKDKKLSLSSLVQNDLEIQWGSNHLAAVQRAPWPWEKVNETVNLDPSERVDEDTTTQVVNLNLELKTFNDKYLKQRDTAAPDSLMHDFCSKAVDFSNQALTDLKPDNNHIFELHKNSKLLKIYDQLFSAIKEKKDCCNVNSDSIKNILPIIFENIEKTADLLTHSENSKNYNEKNLFMKAGLLVYQLIIQQLKFKEIESTSPNSSNNGNTTKEKSLTHAANLYEEAAILNDDPTKQRNLQKKANLYLHSAAALEEAECFFKNEQKNYSDIFSKISDSLLSLAENYDDNIQDNTKIVKAKKELHSVEMQYRKAANDIKKLKNSGSDIAKIIVALPQADSMDSLFEKTTNNDNIEKKQHDSQLDNKLSQLSNSDTGEESSSNPTDEQQNYSKLADAISNISSNLAENLTKKSGLFSAFNWGI